MLRDRIDINGADYTTYFSTSVGILDSQNPINFLPNYYFYAIPTANILRNPALEQTTGWGSGTFNPLE
jgi:hypothetical protein